MKLNLNIEMKRNKILIGTLAVLMIFMAACDNWLSLKPEDGIVGSDYWKTKEQLQAAVVGCYSSLLGNASSSDRTLAEYLFLWGELRADMVAANTGIKAEEQNILNGIIDQNNAVCNWRAVYCTINYCNTVINYAPSVMKSDNTLDSATMKSYVAEALTLRSLMYFYLVRSFGEVPLKLDATLSDDVNLQIPKSSAQTVLNQITSDLRIAEKNAVTTYANGQYDKGRVTKYTVNALQADVYLWKEQYDSCIIACNKIINSGQFGLVRDYSSLFTTGNSNESIFEFQFSSTALNSFFPMFSTSTGRRFLASTIVSDDIYNSEADATDHRGDGVSFKSSNSSIFKYLVKSDGSARTTEESYAHWIVYRYADILLMKAEAEAQTGQGADALDIIKTIRDRGHALTETEQSPEPTDVDGVTDYILAERSREFAFEGKRWYDLLRNAKRNRYARKDILINMVKNSAPPDRQQTIMNNYQDTLSHYFPIYYYELNTDLKLVQNQFYAQ